MPKILREVIHLGIGLVLVLVVTILEYNFHKERKMQTKSARNTAFWAWGCLVALALLGFANKYLNAQEPAPVFYAGLQQGMLGQTVCDKAGNIAILINSNYTFDSTQLRRIVEHENVHVGQVRALGGCEEAGKIYQKDPLAQEVPAYCQELKERMLESNGQGVEVLTNFIAHVHAIYGKQMGLTFDEVMERVYKLCPMEVKNAPP